MADFTIRNGQRGDAKALAALQHRSLQLCPDMDPLTAGFFQSPGLEDGRNLFCAVAPEGALLAYGLVFNGGGGRRYSDIKVDPAAALDPADDRALRDALLARVTERAREMKIAENLSELLLYGCYFEDGRTSVEYLKSRGFQILEEETGLQLTMDLRDHTLPAAPAPQGVAVREWHLETAAERERYVAALGQGLPQSPLTVEQLAFLAASPQFLTMAAFDGDAVAGCATALPRNNTEMVLAYVYVLPAWQRRGIARYLVAEVLRRLQERGAAALQVETALDNHSAIALYEWAGFRRCRREVMLGRQM